MWWLQRAWRKYKEKPEYQTSAFPFLPRRKSVFDKLHDDFVVLVILAGLVWLLIKFAIYVTG